VPINFANESGAYASTFRKIVMIVARGSDPEGTV
jgi:hypothetical protein